ncbi:hypothetical protein SAE02_39640 [Skermanella aerolata]|uniref:Mut7-C RNAse domain-containing protein n=1 Tax=Skermanella aerolata TaxID=393310 RepID=A0A512DTM9_9PROT|nr:hypothetical protein SAE02_39640 [Skermanella aerolata]
MDWRIQGSGVRFLCDEMLHRLGRWLRGAGYDTVIAEGGDPDGVLLARALADGRKLLTRDRAILQRKRANEVVVMLNSDAVRAQAGFLGQTLGVDWLLDPFSRCMVCNTVLTPAAPEMDRMVPARIRDQGVPIHFCPGCGRLYWPGSHESRIRATLLDFARASGR